MNLKIAPPPPAPRTKPPHIEVTGEKDRLLIKGQVASTKTHDSIVNSILGMKGIDKLDDKLIVGDDVKEEKWLSPLPAFIRGYYNGSVKNRQLWLKNRELTLSGVVANQKLREDVLASAEPLKKQGVRIVDRLTIEEPKTVAMVDPKMVPKDPGNVTKADKPKATDKGKGTVMVAKADTPKAKAKAKGKGKSKGTKKTGPGKVDPPPTPKTNVMAKGDSRTKSKGNQAAAPPGKTDQPKTATKDPIKPIIPENGDLYQVFFGTGEFHIRDSEMGRADKALEGAKNSRGKIVIDGFADERGDVETNDFLSDARANRVRQYLILNGIDESRIVSVTGRGEISSPRGKYPKFRRTDIRILD